MTPNFIASMLDISTEDAQQLATDLVEEGWLKRDKAILSAQGMGLANYEDRPRLPRQQADEIVRHTIEWAKDVNSRTGARVLIESIELFGSYLGSCNDVGDIDMVVKFNTSSLEDLDSKDLDKEDAILNELLKISDYISPANEFDKLTLSSATFRKIFPEDV